MQGVGGGGLEVQEKSGEREREREGREEVVGQEESTGTKKDQIKGVSWGGEDEEGTNREGTMYLNDLAQKGGYSRTSLRESQHTL